MQVVETDLHLSLGFKNKEEYLDELKRHFRSRCETIKACGGQTGYNKRLYEKALAPELIEEGFDSFADVGSDTVMMSKIKTAALTTSS